MSPNRKKKRDKTAIFAIVTVSLLVGMAAIGFLVLPFFGVYGMFRVLDEWGLVQVTVTDGFIDNAAYFTFVILVMYLTTLALDILSKIMIVIRKKKLAISRGSMILNYGIQTIVAAFVFKLFIDHNFSRIDLSLSGAVFSFAVLYMIYYAAVDDYEIE